jgi:putative endonuclease
LLRRALASRRNGTLYIGVPNDLVRRVTEHKGKLVPGFTRKYGVDQLVYFEELASITEARRASTPSSAGIATGRSR